MVRRDAGSSSRRVNEVPAWACRAVLSASEKYHGRFQAISRRVTARIVAAVKKRPCPTVMLSGRRGRTSLAPLVGPIEGVRKGRRSIIQSYIAAT